MLAALLIAPTAIPAQTLEYTGDYRTDVAHPRLWLPPRRARLLSRETTREALRWVQFDAFIRGGVKMPEPGFASALYYVATQSREQGRQAVDWALSPVGTDLRQLAIVFDWCQALLTAVESKTLVTKIEALLAKSTGQDLGSVRDRVIAALAITDHTDSSPHVRYIKPMVEEWWQTKVSARILKGETPVDLRDHLALLELLHALRDNLEIDLRETARKHFTSLPIFHILGHYPAPFPAAENDYRVPLMQKQGEPDPREMARSRAAALAMVAYDNNAKEMLFLQGWLIQDRFLLRSTYGIPYEFLWANPYQPGLSYHYLPNVFHDPETGRLIIRSTWEEDAVWYYQLGGTVQIFREGNVINMRQEQIQKQIEMGNTILLPANLASKFRVNTGESKMHYYVVGLKSSSRYELEVDDEEMREVQTDPGGVLELNFPVERAAGVLLRPVGPR